MLFRAACYIRKAWKPQKLLVEVLSSVVVVSISECAMKRNYMQTLAQTISIFMLWMIWGYGWYVSSGCIYFILAWLMEPQHDRRKCRKDGHIPPLVENYIICGSWSVSEQPTNVDDKSLRLDRSTRNVNSIQCFTLTFTHIQRHAPASICIIQL